MAVREDQALNKIAGTAGRNKKSGGMYTGRATRDNPSSLMTHSSRNVPPSQSNKGYTRRGTLSRCPPKTPRSTQ